MSVLVLNADFQPLNVTSINRSYSLVYTGKAEVVEYDEDVATKVSKAKYRRPLIVRLIRYVYIPFKKVPLTRQNIYRRDGHKCGYCKSNRNLTLDHIVPKSRGGKNTWDNLVTCCQSCNTKKDNRTPKEAGMPLLVKAYRPTFQQFIKGMNKGHLSRWSQYLSD